MSNISVILEQAQLLLDQGRSKDAEARVKQALEQDPENDYALSLLARCFYNTKQYDEGITAIQRAISLDPEESFYFYLLGFGHYQKDNGFEAAENVKKAIVLNPYNAEYYGLLAFIQITEKRFEEGLAKANEGLAIEAENITCLNARAMALNKLKRTDAAIATMENALSQDPDNEFTHTTIGWNLLERGNHNDAAKHFREALRIDPMRNSAKSGLKEALKSKIPPYKWLLQYSFWVNNKGKKLRTILPIVLYIAFRVLISIFRSNSATTGLAWVLAGVYLLFVIGSWTMNSIANFFLLFHPDGKFALTNTEKWSAIAVVTALFSSFFIIMASLFTSVAKGTAYEESLIIAGMVCLSLALPFGEINYPIDFKNKSGRNVFSLLLIGAGIFSLLFYILFPAPAVMVMAIYGVGFILYNWSGVFRK
jgi:cytochrome c-type biogenesis protein CcmH/NrfG